MAVRSLIVSTLAAHASAVWLGGVNIAGCEIGIDTSVSNAVYQSLLCFPADKTSGQLRSQRVRKPVWMPIGRHGEDSDAAFR
jgi:hypothetical protein